MKIGEAILDLRRQKSLKQKDLAKDLNISATYLSLIEHGEQKPSIDLIARIAQYFDLPITALFFKALEIDKIKSKEQKKYFETAEPIVDALISFLLSGETTTKGKPPLVRIKFKKRTQA